MGDTRAASVVRAIINAAITALTSGDVGTYGRTAAAGVARMLPVDHEEFTVYRESWYWPHESARSHYFGTERERAEKVDQMPNTALADFLVNAGPVDSGFAILDFSRQAEEELAGKGMLAWTYTAGGAVAVASGPLAA